MAVTPIVTDAIAGPFRAVYGGPGLSSITDATLAGAANPSAGHLGVIGARGIRQIRRYEGEEYSADLLGNSIVESVYMGGQMFLEFELEEANITQVKYLQNQFRKSFATPTVDGSNEVGVPGTFATSYAGSLALLPLYTGTSGHTTAGTQTTPCRIYGLVTLAAGFELETLLASKRRTIPVRLRCYPYSDGASPAKYIWYSHAAAPATYSVD